MNEEIEKILRHTPYNSYDDLFGALFRNKASIKLSNSACRQIASLQMPFFANIGLHLGIIPSAILTVLFSIGNSNYYLLLLLLLILFFPITIYLFKNLNFKVDWIAYALTLCDLFIIKLPTAVLVLSVSWLICTWIINAYSRKIYKTSIQILQYNKEAFVWAFNSHNLLIEDCYGNIYNKFSLDETEAKASL